MFLSFCHGRLSHVRQQNWFRDNQSRLRKYRHFERHIVLFQADHWILPLPKIVPLISFSFHLPSFSLKTIKAYSTRIRVNTPFSPTSCWGKKRLVSKVSLIHLNLYINKISGIQTIGWLSMFGSHERCRQVHNHRQHWRLWLMASKCNTLLFNDTQFIQTLQRNILRGGAAAVYVCGEYPSVLLCLHKPDIPTKPRIG